MEHLLIIYLQALEKIYGIQGNISNIYIRKNAILFFNRPGEPLWAEISRLLFRFSFLAIFITITTVLVLQVQNSPIINQQYYDHNSDYSVMAPGT